MAILSNIITPTNVLTSNSTNTVTNKTIAFASNTLTGVQPTLVSGSNIKTINNASVLGSGNLEIASGAQGFVTTVGPEDNGIISLQGAPANFGII